MIMETIYLTLDDLQDIYEIVRGVARKISRDDLIEKLGNEIEEQICNVNYEEEND